MKRFLAGLLIAVALFSAPAHPARAGQAADQLERVKHFLAGLESFEVETTMSSRIIPPRGPAQTVNGRAALAAALPDRLAVRHGNDQLGGTVVGDGTHLWIYHPRAGAFVKRKTPLDLLTLTRDPDFMAALGQVSLLEPLLFGRGEGDERLEAAAYHGQESIGGQAAHRIGIRMSLPAAGGDENLSLPAELWIAEGEAAWPLRFRPDFEAYFEEARARGEQVPPVQMELTYAFENWSRGVESPEEAFAFTPPEDVEEAESFEAAVQAQGGSGGEGLQGQAAPEIDLEKLGGGRFTLSEAEETVVILDFWASWCGPCVRAMPKIEAVRDWARAEDLSVAVYTVNLRESEAKARDFLEQHGIDLPVLMDRRGEAGRRYRVSGIPTTVLVAGGKVAHQHVGVHPELEAKLKSQITALLEE